MQLGSLKFNFIIPFSYNTKMTMTFTLVKLNIINKIEHKSIYFWEMFGLLVLLAISPNKYFHNEVNSEHFFFFFTKLKPVKEGK